LDLENSGLVISHINDIGHYLFISQIPQGYQVLRDIYFAYSPSGSTVHLQNIFAIYLYSVDRPGRYSRIFILPFFREIVFTELA
jgi:hypothetical protein